MTTGCMTFLCKKAHFEGNRPTEQHAFEYRYSPQLCLEARPGLSRGLSRTALPTREERAFPTTENGLSPLFSASIGLWKLRDI
jgi:hypothetical protein